MGGKLAAATVAAISGKALHPIALQNARKTLFQALADVRSRSGGSRPAIVDGDETVATYDTLVMGSLALGNALRKGTEAGEAVGVMLPTCLGAVIAFFALSAFGRVPTMLNFSYGVAGVLSALHTARVKRVVTARKFVEMAKLNDMMAKISRHAEIVYLEDVKDRLTVCDKALAVVGKFAPAFVSRKLAAYVGDPAPYDRPAVILFTSGTEGEPKGVALSHFNILVNIEQASAHVALYSHDVMFNALPMFHCFGLNTGTILPLILGFKTVLHPTPLQPKEISRRIRETGATILITTDTFMSQYARAGAEGDLKELRIVACGAERVRDETRQLLRRKGSVDILEGYGLTEASPLAAINQPEANHAGTIGHILPGMDAKVVPVEGIPNAGRMFIRGPNVMLGYIRSNAPGVIETPPDGWHDTGDVVHIDEEGFISIKGRLKRFAKIGGEAVSLAVVENIALSLWPDFSHAAISLPDGHKGEYIALLTTNPTADRVDLVGWAQNHGVSELTVPRRIIRVAAVPVLGTGKIDYAGVERLVRAEKPAVV
jgi:acyl-[acyl-carrier-protein]-phospholipid O-acyltransferase / long-chain-fatty-acid--[acyl-carrier-protein] ligase